MATTNDDTWMANINRMYRDEEAKWNRDRFREMPSDEADSELTTEKGQDDAESK